MVKMVFPDRTSVRFSHIFNFSTSKINKATITIHGRHGTAASLRILRYMSSDWLRSVGLSYLVTYSKTQSTNSRPTFVYPYHSSILQQFWVCGGNCSGKINNFDRDLQWPFELRCNHRPKLSSYEVSHRTQWNCDHNYIAVPSTVLHC